jgi:hypothetical protein
MKVYEVMQCRQEDYWIAAYKDSILLFQHREDAVRWRDRMHDLLREIEDNELMQRNKWGDFAASWDREDVWFEINERKLR